jgi:hypothetical protein
MLINPHELGHPIRVVVFSSGPTLEQGVRRFILRLADHREIALLGVICHSRGQSWREVVLDLWQRRRFLAVPLLVRNGALRALRYFSDPRTERESRRKLAQLSSLIRFVPDIHAEDVLAQVRSLSPDLGLVYGSPILKPALYEIPTFGTLGIHHGQVPQYRGKKTMFWAMYHGEKTAGVTIQQVNSGLDTGAIVKQGHVTIGRCSQRAVWRDLEDLGLELYIQAILDVHRGLAESNPQNGQRGPLYHDPKMGDILSFYWRRWRRRLAR